jgi:ATP-dependent helicase HepA
MSELFFIGQRWISDSESDLGLGTIIDEELRRITVLFHASGETRIYAKESAPLTRVLFSAGDTLTSHDGWKLLVDKVEADNGLLVYHGHREDTGEAVRLPESKLNNMLQFQSPRDRLFAGLLDGHRWFVLRRQVFEHQHALAHSPVRGLMGARIALLPHQLYIAVESTRRTHPRILLADEVGLGKTIEAGLILHSQLVNQQVSRVLVVVPSALLHQWLVEMLRKFNLTFSIMDEERYLQLQDTAPEGNPFMAEQLVLCSTDTLLDNDVVADAAIAAGWDTLIVDEAHHLQWQEDEASEAYELVEALADVTPSVMLLTATPEQLGQAGHFARLRLLDSVRFSSLETYLAEESEFEWVAGVARKLSNDEALDKNEIAQLETRLDTTFDTNESTTLSSSTSMAMSDLGQSLLDKLIDRHGTGRLLFRNTRSAVPGFPERKFTAYTLDEDSLESLATWMIEFTADHYPEKVLLICAQRESVQALTEILRLAGVSSAQFHEDMTIVERDRAAAWFADDEDGCQIMLCSEIGSEGRNFQFLHHLVLAELPDNPDLLEQRIGRLDRIGQTDTIQIHVPTATGSRDALLSRWYHEGLNGFEKICKTGYTIYNQLGEKLQSVLAGEGDLDALIEETKALNAQLNTQLEAGRDRLLELNSNKPEQIQEHLDALARLSREYTLQDFMSAVFDRFGVNVEDQDNSWIVHPGEHMQMESFPHLPDSGMTITLDRKTALQREDFVFLSWDHPMVSDSMDLILDEGYGQADCQVIMTEAVPKGLAVVEAVYVMQCVADVRLNIERYLPSGLHTFYYGIDGKDYTDELRSVVLDTARQRYDRNKLKGVVQKHRELINSIIEKTSDRAQLELPDFIEEARESIDVEFQSERERLVALQKINNAVRDDEIDVMDARHKALVEALDGVQARPVGVRVLFNN